MEFAYEIIDGLPIDNGNILISMVTYFLVTKTEWLLGGKCMLNIHVFIHT